MLAVTHDGTFHADELLALAMLRILHPGLAIERSRDPARVAAADLAVDVGAADDPAAGRYDHHGRDRRLRPDGVPYSACGLVWRHLGAAIAARLAPDPADAPLRGALAAEIDGGLVRGVDAIDNGVEPAAATDFASLVDALNPVPGEPQAGAFERALALADTFLRRAAIHALAGLRGRAAVAAAAGASPDPRVLVLDRPVPFGRAVRDLGLDRLLYVVHPDAAGREWYCRAVPDPEAGALALRRPLPAAWGGLRDADFAAAAGVADGLFCHPALFLCGARSRASALQLARAALA